MIPPPKNLMELPDILRGRYISTTVHCPVCGTVIGRRLGNKWTFEKKNGGITSEVPMIVNDKYSQGGYRVECPDKKCKGAHIVEWFNENIKMEEKFNAAVNQDINT